MTNPERDIPRAHAASQPSNEPSGIAAWLIRQAQQFEDQHAPQHLTIGLREAAGEIERLRADLAHADAKGQENDKLLWGTIKANERLRAALREIASWEPGASAVARAALAEEKTNGLRPDRRTNVAERLFGND